MPHCDNTAKGNFGEDVAALCLQKKGYEIIARKYRSPYGEIDIISKKDDILVFVEVKLRNSIKFGYPVEAVTKKKQTAIIKTALHYIAEHTLDSVQPRFDVVEIFGQKNCRTTHIESAFFCE